MAAAQVGTGSLTLGAPLTAAAIYITVPANAIVESVSVQMPGDAQMETQYDSDGAFHSDIWYEKRCFGATVVVVGKAFSGNVGDKQGTSSDYEIMSIDEEKSKGPVRTTVTVKKVVLA
jgi:hypothetical protein